MGNHTVPSDAAHVGGTVAGVVALSAFTMLDLFVAGLGSQRRMVNALLVRGLYVAIILVVFKEMEWAGGFNISPSCKTCSLSFKLHPPLMSIGFLVLMSEALMSYNTLPVCALRRSTQKLFHASCNAMAIVLVSAGAAVAFVNHEEKRKEEAAGSVVKTHHMSSQHSWMGMATLALLAFQFLMGAFAFFVSKDERWKRSVLPGHKFIGAMTYLTACITIILGLTEWGGDGQPYSDQTTVNATAVLLVWCVCIRVLAGFVPGAHERSHHTPLLEGAEMEDPKTSERLIQ